MTKPDERKQTEIYPSEFGEFFKAMVAEMKRHKKEKGDSWKKSTIVVGIMYPTHSNYNENHGIPNSIITDKYLQDLLEVRVKDFLRKKDKDELVDIANICGMLWCRK